MKVNKYNQDIDLIKKLLINSQSISTFPAIEEKSIENPKNKEKIDQFDQFVAAPVTPESPE